jgi:hypothetical protein
MLVLGLSLELGVWFLVFTSSMLGYVAHAQRPFRPVGVSTQNRKQHGRKHPDDGDNLEQFDQGQSCLRLACSCHSGSTGHGIASHADCGN